MLVQGAVVLACAHLLKVILYVREQAVVLVAVMAQLPLSGLFLQQETSVALDERALIADSGVKLVARHVSEQLYVILVVDVV